MQSNNSVRTKHGICRTQGRTHIWGSVDQNVFKISRWQQKDCPVGPVVKNPSASTGAMGLIPGPGRAHMPQSNYASAPQLPKPLCPRAGASKPLQGEARARQPVSSPQRDKVHEQQRRPSVAKNKLINSVKQWQQKNHVQGPPGHRTLTAQVTHP